MLGSVTFCEFENAYSINVNLIDVKLINGLYWLSTDWELVDNDFKVVGIVRRNIELGSYVALRKKDLTDVGIVWEIIRDNDFTNDIDTLGEQLGIDLLDWEWL